MANKFETFF